MLQTAYFFVLVFFFCGLCVWLVFVLVTLAVPHPLFFHRLLQKGTKAPQAAGKIHTDFEKGFIMAEVMKYEDFKEYGSETAVKVRFTSI